MKGKGERERYTQLNVEFQRITWRDKKVFLDEQCQELKENNRIGKTRDLSLQENWRYGGNFSCKDRHDKGERQYGQKHKRLRRGGKNTQKNYTKKILMTWITMMVWSLN